MLYGHIATPLHIGGTSSGLASPTVPMGAGSPVVPFKAMTQYYISFVYYLHPNTLSWMGYGKRLTKWPRWMSGKRKLVEFQKDAVGISRDNF